MIEPRVDLSIAVYNQWDKTKRFLDSFFKYTKYQNYQLNIIDNSSKDSTVNELDVYAEMDKVNVIWNDNRESFSACHNKVLSKAKGKYCCVLAHDIEIVTFKWLEKMVMYAENNERCGILAPIKIIGQEPDLKRLYGGRIEDDAFCFNICEENEMDKIEYIQSSCMLIKNSLIKRIEVFDERFVGKYYDDIDFCIRATEAGYTIDIALDVEVFYYDDEDMSWKTNQENNRKLFVEKQTEWLIKNKGAAVKRLRRSRIHGTT